MDRSPSLFHGGLTPYSDSFPAALDAYSSQIQSAIRQNKHHDQRRNLLINFFREGMGLDPVEFELEKKVKVHAIRGRIDAFFKQLIIEVKTDIENEREDGKREFKKYFEAQAYPREFVGLLTDGRDCEVYHYDRGKICHIRSFVIDADLPLDTFRNLDQLFFTANRLPPTPLDIVDRFGPHSTAYNTVHASMMESFERVQADSAVAVKFHEWNALLAKVYGSEIGDVRLFITHTYLVMLTRVVLAHALFPKSRKSQSTYRGILAGEFFRQNRLVNLAEPDFFSWAMGTESEKDFLNDLGRLFLGLTIYDFAKLDGDILKELYQGLVDPQSRHDLGEYYTPDWLAELTLETIDYKGGRLLDPSCGSGSFLYAAARRLAKSAGVSGEELVSRVTSEIIGIDVHPVAVMMAKANLLLALREHFTAVKGETSLQVYMADTLMTGDDKEYNRLTVPVSNDQETFHIPFETIDRGASSLDRLIDTLCELAKRGAVALEKEKGSAEAAKNLFQRNGFSSSEIFYWQQNFRLLLKLEKEKRNSVWAYILKNAYRPAYLRRDKMKYVVGNPPWLAYAFIQDGAYKKRVKELTFEHGLLGTSDRKLFTRMETATLFFAHCERDFLDVGGTIAFVMPKTAMLPSKQHIEFQQRGFTRILDLGQVRPLFNVRSCVLIRGKRHSVRGIPLVCYSADFGGERNLSLQQARSHLAEKRDTHDVAAIDHEPSPYYSQFFQGATLVPRCFWFVEPVDKLGMQVDAPYVRTSSEAHASAKAPWTMQVEGRIEKEFLFGTVLAKNLLPFMVRSLTLVALPVAKTNKALIMVHPQGALTEGFVYAHDWFEQAESIWVAHRRNSSRTALQWLNYDNKLTNQPNTKCFVLYNQSGTNISASVILPSECKSISGLPIQGLVIDSKCYWLAAKNEDEAHYLVGVLNSEVVNSAIKPYQTEGLQGKRDIHRRPFEVCPIPVFDPSIPLHEGIAKTARLCRKQLTPIISSLNASAAAMRGEVRSILSNQLSKLDVDVAALLGNPSIKKNGQDSAQIHFALEF